jgi:hypothetical protein
MYVNDIWRTIASVSLTYKITLHIIQQGILQFKQSFVVQSCVKQYRVLRHNFGKEFLICRYQKCIVSELRLSKTAE